MRMNMSDVASPNEQAPSLDSARDRSHSQDQTMSFHNPVEVASGTHKIDNNNNNYSSLPESKMATATAATKENPHRHHRGNRPRSKSCELHRRSPTLQKPKKYPTVHKHIPSSPKPAFTSRYRGNMWIRPVAVRGPMKFMHAYGRVAPYAEQSREQQGQQQIEDASMDADFASFTPARQVSQSPDLDEEEMKMFLSPNTSFDTYGESGSSPTGSPKNAKIIFGESGKPIKPKRTMVPSGETSKPFKPNRMMATVL